MLCTAKICATRACLHTVRCTSPTLASWLHSLLSQHSPYVPFQLQAYACYPLPDPSQTTCQLSVDMLALSCDIEVSVVHRCTLTGPGSTCSRSSPFLSRRFLLSTEEQCSCCERSSSKAVLLALAGLGGLLSGWTASWDSLLSVGAVVADAVAVVAVIAAVVSAQVGTVLKCGGDNSTFIPVGPEAAMR